MQGGCQRKEAMASSRTGPTRTAPLPPTPPQKEPTFTCPLCMDPLTNPCSTFCGHIFCQSCIEASIAAASVKKRAGKQCPTCRAKLPVRKSFHRVYLPCTDCWKVRVSIWFCWGCCYCFPSFDCWYQIIIISWLVKIESKDVCALFCSELLIVAAQLWRFNISRVPCNRGGEGKESE